MYGFSVFWTLWNQQNVLKFAKKNLVLKFIFSCWDPWDMRYCSCQSGWCCRHADAGWYHGRHTETLRRQQGWGRPTVGRRTDRHLSVHRWWSLLPCQGVERHRCRHCRGLFWHFVRTGQLSVLPCCFDYCYFFHSSATIRTVPEAFCFGLSVSRMCACLCDQNWWYTFVNTTSYKSLVKISPKLQLRGNRAQRWTGQILRSRGQAKAVSLQWLADGILKIQMRCFEARPGIVWPFMLPTPVIYRDVRKLVKMNANFDFQNLSNANTNADSGNYFICWNVLHWFRSIKWLL